MNRLLYVAPRFALLWLAMSPALLARAQMPAVLSSPDGGVRVSASIQQLSADAPNATRFFFSVAYAGRPLLLDSPFSLDFKGQPSFAGGLTIADVQHRSADDTWQRVWGKRASVRNHFNEMTLTLAETADPHRRVDLVFRAYDDGVAVRYVLPASWGAFSLTRENLAFSFPGTPLVWAANFEGQPWSGLHGGFVSPQEAEFQRMPMADLDPRQVYGLPMLVQVNDAAWAAVTEADLTDWAGMYLTPSPTRRSTLATALSPRRDEPDVLVRSAAPRRSPWRALMLARTPAALIESDLIQNLNDPAEGDFSWVEPGKSAWDRWWSHDYAPEVDFKVGMNTATMKYFVDLAAEMGWKYQLVDADWYGPPFAEGHFENPHPTSDITTVIPALDLPELIRYADERGVKILLWLHWAHAAAQMEEAFPLYEKWGVAGVKIDYMNRDDQEMVNFYQNTVKLAAENHLVVDFHGAYKPTGWSRTYPNMMTREGILGNEYNKWSDRVTPEHTVTIPFTRGLLGEMDFTPGGFRNRTRETFRTEDPAPNVMGTRVHQLAMLVVYESALAVLADGPYNYHISPAGTDFLKLVPTSWDETVALGGFPGDFVTLARRSGSDWYVAAMTDWTPRNLPIPLSYLPGGRFQAEIWADAYEAAAYPDRLMKSSRIVTASDTLDAALAPGGGYIVKLTPVR